MAIPEVNAPNESHQNGGPKVAIVGAGLTGLITAHGLKKNGFEVTVFERDASIDARPRDWTILIHWGMSTLTEMLPDHIVNSFPKAYCNPHLQFDDWDESVLGYNALTGEVLFRNSTPGARRVSRRRFREILAEGLDIQWGKGLKALDIIDDDSVRLSFNDDSNFDANYVLGTDVRGQGLQHAIIDSDKYVKALILLRKTGDTAMREETMTLYGADVVARGCTAVAQSLSEAEKAMNKDTVSKMLMVMQGHGRSI
ncbi:hypothetical protein K4K57_012667 [Colletotrichum sp. SAR 10_99]|nr:hypothetical protein K4K56_001077 [Colletotrichum sp. SAR 10_98]KAJ5019526.1 hypothetical protein K4K57_012667 [Colletotrichum sp. SAR 10_99]